MAITDFLSEEQLRRLLDEQYSSNQNIISRDAPQLSFNNLMELVVPDQFLSTGNFENAPMRDMNTGIVPLLKNNIPTIQNPGAPQSLGFDTSFGIANEEDEEQVEFLGSRPSGLKQGIAKLFELFQKFSPIGNIARGIESIRDRFDTRQAIIEDIARDTQGGPITTFRNIKQQQQDKIDDRGRGEIPTRSPAPSRPSTTYQDAKNAFTSSR
jgi:hypothetical protein